MATINNNELDSVRRGKLNANYSSISKNLINAHNADYIPQGFAHIGDATPAATLNHAYLAAETGTIFGIAVAQGQVLFANGTSWAAQEIEIKGASSGVTGIDTTNLISQYEFQEGNGTDVADKFGNNPISVISNGTWTPKGVRLEDGLIETPTINNVRTIAVLCRIPTASATAGFAISLGVSGGNGFIQSQAQINYGAYVGTANGVLPLNRRDSNGTAVFQFQSPGFQLIFLELDIATNTKIGFGGRHSAVTSRVSEFEIAAAFVYSDVFTDQKRQDLYDYCRKIALSRFFYISNLDVPYRVNGAVLCGDSISVGRAEIADLSAADQGLIHLETKINYSNASDHFMYKSLRLGYNGQIDDPLNEFGPEMWAAKSYEQDNTLDKELFIVKQGIGGSALGDDLQWQPEYVIRANYFYSLLKQIFVMNQYLLTLGIGVEWKNVWVSLGANDAVSDAESAAFQVNIQAFWDRIKPQLNSPGLKIVIPNIADTDPAISNPANFVTINNAINAFVAANADAETFSVAGMTYAADLVHPDAAGTKLMGQRYYDNSTF